MCLYWETYQTHNTLFFKRQSLNAKAGGRPAYSNHCVLRVKAVPVHACHNWHVELLSAQRLVSEKGFCKGFAIPALTFTDQQVTRFCIFFIHATCPTHLLNLVTVLYVFQNFLRTVVVYSVLRLGHEWKIRGLHLGGSKRFISSKTSRPALGPTQPTI